MAHEIRSPGMFAKYPFIGLAMCLVGGLIFGLLAYNVVTHGPLLAWDVPVANSLHATALASPGWVRSVMIAGYYVGAQLIALTGLVFAIYFARKRHWLEFAMLCSSFGGPPILFRLLSQHFDRARPVFESQVWRVSSLPGFPSGHAIGVVASYGLLAYFFVPTISSKLGKSMVIAVTLLIALYVGYSRLFVGQHFLTDIVSGYAVGIAWAGLASTIVERIFRNRAKAGGRAHADA